MAKTKYLTEDEMVEVLKAWIKEQGSQAKAAQRLGISSQYMNDTLRRGRGIGPSVLQALGYRRVTVYVKEDAGDAT